MSLVDFFQVISDLQRFCQHLHAVSEYRSKISNTGHHELLDGAHFHLEALQREKKILFFSLSLARSKKISLEILMDFMTRSGDH